MPYPREVIRFLCSGCGDSVPDVQGLTAADGIDSGTTLKCPECDQDTIVDLFQPEERSELYRARKWITLLPTYALTILAEPESYRDPTIIKRARVKVKEWLAEMS